MRKFCAFYK